MPDKAMGRVVIGVVGDDIHVVGNRIMELALRESGFQVFNLGTRNRPEHFCEATLEVNADAVFISSLNGEGEHWCADFRLRMNGFGLEHVVLYAGGNLVVGKRPEHEVVQLFKTFGFDRVYHQKPDISGAIADLLEDLRNGATKRRIQAA